MPGRVLSAHADGAMCAGPAANPSFGDALRSAKAGDSRSQYVVGMMYLFGQGTRADAAEGARWIKSSAGSGMPQALVALASCMTSATVFRWMPPRRRSCGSRLPISAIPLPRRSWRPTARCRAHVISVARTR